MIWQMMTTYNSRKEESQATEFETKVLDRNEDVIKQRIHLAGSSSCLSILSVRGEHCIAR